MTLFWIACGLQVLQLAIATGLCHAIMQRIYGRYFLTLRRHNYWLHTLGALLLTYAGILVTSSNSIEMLLNYNGNGGGEPVTEPSPTMRTTQGHCLVEPPDWDALVEDCGYRMLQAHEAKWLMGFPRDYIILGTQEEQFKQAGNAVTPPVAELLGRAVVESLS